MTGLTERTGTDGEPRATRLRRLHMRSIRRGIKEMDIILGTFAVRLPELADEELDLYDALLCESDQDLYQWVTGQAATPGKYLDLVTKIASDQGETRSR